MKRKENAHILHGMQEVIGSTPIFSTDYKALIVYIMEIVTTLFRAKLTQGLADFWVAANAIKARTKIVI